MFTESVGGIRQGQVHTRSCIHIWSCWNIFVAWCQNLFNESIYIILFIKSQSRIYTQIHICMYRLTHTHIHVYTYIFKNGFVIADKLCMWKMFAWSDPRMKGHTGTIWTLQWRHNEHDGVANHQLRDCLSHRLFRRRSKQTPKLRVTGLCAGNSPVTGEFPAQTPVTRKMFPSDNVIMKTNGIGLWFLALCRLLVNGLVGPAFWRVVIQYCPSGRAISACLMPLITNGAGPITGTRDFNSPYWTHFGRDKIAAIA